jgi:hypothetical protein
MRPEVYWVGLPAGRRLAMMPRPRADDWLDGRSSLIAAWALVLFGLTPAAAFNLIGKARVVDLPDTQGQRDRVDRFSETMTTGGIHPA